MNHNHCLIRQETPDDYQEVEYLTREAFWNVYRPGCIEHYIVHQYRCREDFVPELDFVMEKDDVIIGHIMYVNAEILSDNGQKIPIMTFGPISIAPEHQRKGYGKILLDFSMDKARALGVGAICIEGNIAFYGKSGFVTASSKGIHYYAEPRSARVPYFLVKELQEGFLDGVTGTYKPPSGYFKTKRKQKNLMHNFQKKRNVNYLVSCSKRKKYVSLSEYFDLVKIKRVPNILVVQTLLEKIIYYHCTLQLHLLRIHVILTYSVGLFIIIMENHFCKGYSRFFSQMHYKGEKRILIKQDPG